MKWIEALEWSHGSSLIINDKEDTWKRRMVLEQKQEPVNCLANFYELGTFWHAIDVKQSIKM